MCPADASDATKTAHLVEITPLLDTDAGAWAEFVRNSNDGTLHHELTFLAYHPPERFRFAHTVMRQGSRIVAVLPGGLVEREGSVVFESPMGASVGGLLVDRPILAQTISIVDALQSHARAQGWKGIELVLGPTAYQKNAADTTAFALFARGFQLTERNLSFIVPLAPGATDAYSALFRTKQAWSVRAAFRRGVTVEHGGAELLDPFLQLFHETYERHGTAATHSDEEVADLLQRLPDRIEITVAWLGEVPLAGILVFRLNERAAQTFYICSNKAHARENGTVAALAALIDRLSAAGVRALDLGPSASSRRVNEGVVFFKEGLGAVGQSRDRWTWSVDP